MASMYQTSEESLESIRREARKKDWFQNWIEEINRSQGLFENYKVPNFTTVQGEAGFIELLANAELNRESRRK